MSQASQQHKGLSLLELLLVLAIIAILVFLGINRYQLYKREKDIAAVKQNVNLLMQATNNYYRINCQNGIPFQVSIQDLINSGLMPTLISNGIAQTYAVGAAKMPWQTQVTKKDIYQLFVTATLNVPSTTLDWYQKVLNATSISGNTLTWTQFPSYTIPTLESGLWIMGAELREFKESTASQQDDKSCAY